MKKISVALATYNEEKNLSDCLASVEGWVDEIVIIDGSSTDKTIEIAKKYKARIIITDNPPIFHVNKQKAIEACTGNWILQLDADETITKELKEEILNTINLQFTTHQPAQAGNRHPINGYYLPRKNYLLGHWLKKGGAYPDYVLRLFRNGKGKFPCKSVHEQIEIIGKVGYLKNALIHRSYPTFLQYLRKADVYTSLSTQTFAEEKIKINFSTLIIYIIIMPIKTFFNLYIRHLGFLDGFPGFIWAFFSALHHPIAFIKYWGNKKRTNKE